MGREGEVVADLCKQCSEEIYQLDGEDLAGLCGKGFIIDVLCEGCGLTFVDENGFCQGRCDNYEHSK